MGDACRTTRVEGASKPFVRHLPPPTSPQTCVIIAFTVTAASSWQHLDQQAELAATTPHCDDTTLSTGYKAKQGSKQPYISVDRVTQASNHVSQIVITILMKNPSTSYPNNTTPSRPQAKHPSRCSLLSTVNDPTYQSIGVKYKLWSLVSPLPPPHCHTHTHTQGGTPPKPQLPLMLHMSNA